MVLEPIKPEVLAVRVIPQVDEQLGRRLGLRPEQKSIGLITCTIDDCLYAALDEGTKMAQVEVVYAHSFYAGSAHASGPFSGEIIGIFAAGDPENIVSALNATVKYLEEKAWFYSADDRNRLAFFPHVIPSVGRYLAKQAGVDPGTPMAYLIAPPIEAILGLDAGLKAARVELKVYYPPPSETNFAGGLLVGDQPEVEACAEAFRQTVLDLAKRPVALSPAPKVEKLAQKFGGKIAKKGIGDRLPFQIYKSGFQLSRKPNAYTHLFDNSSLVYKDHPVIQWRGVLDELQAMVIDTSVCAIQEGRADIANDLNEILDFLRKVMSAEVTGRPMPELSMGGFTAEEIHLISHNTLKYMGVGWVIPDPSMGQLVAKLNLLRTHCRRAELCAIQYLQGCDHLSEDNFDRLIYGLNRLSSAIYILVCKVVGTLNRAVHQK